jgi:hypothetical protein
LGLERFILGQRRRRREMIHKISSPPKHRMKVLLRAKLSREDFTESVGVLFINFPWRDWIHPGDGIVPSINLYMYSSLSWK